MTLSELGENPRRLLILLGPPGAGKGTQSARLVNRLNATHVASGDLLRNAALRQGATADLIRDHARAGTLVPEGVVLSLVARALAAAPSGWVVVDGYPKTASQAGRLYQTSQDLGLMIERAVHLKADPELIRQRLLDRAITSDRQDDDPATIDRRVGSLGVTPPDLLSWYASRHQLVEVDASLPIEVVTDHLLRGLDLTP